MIGIKYKKSEAVNPIVEGTKHDTGFMGFSFCDEYCPHCGNEVYNIPANRVSLCPECKAELFPCSVCEDGCSWSRDTLGCHRFEHSDEYKQRERTA